MHIDNVIFLILSKNAYTKFSAGPRLEQRTPERFAEVGGNVDYERFREEVLLPLKSGKAFSYRPFDCSTFTLAAPVAVTPKKLNIVEGTYSHHPYFGNPYDLKILLTVDEETQRQRILERPIFLHKRFFEEWIPMEQRYFDNLLSFSNCDTCTPQVMLISSIP